MARILWWRRRRLRRILSCRERFITAAEAIEAAGGKALPLELDIRAEEQVKAAVEKAAEHFGGIDMLVNNASAISLTGTAETSLKRFDLMMGVNVRGTFVCSQACLPYLAKAANPQILTLSPPLNMQAKWFGQHVAYTIAKYGMSMCVLGMAEEFRPLGIGVNALWPRTIIATAALQIIPGAHPERGRTPEIVADAAHWILTQDSRATTGNFFIDDEVLARAGVTDLSRVRDDAGRAAADGLLPVGRLRGRRELGSGAGCGIIRPEENRLNEF